MRFLADAGISPATVDHLQGTGHDVLHVRHLGMQRAPDREILALAAREARIVLTFDLDFGALLALGVRSAPSVVIFRLDDETAASVNRQLDAILPAQSRTLTEGALVLVEDRRYRVRNLPISR